MSNNQPDALMARLQRLEARVAALEAQRPPAAAEPPPATAGPSRFFVLDGLQAQSPGQGAVAYGGIHRRANGGELRWQMARTQTALLQQDWPAFAAALSALSHPVRLQLLRQLVEGPSSVQQLAALPGLGTTGQLYHHLRELEATGWVRTESRGVYAVPAERVIPLLAILTALMG